MSGSPPNESCSPSALGIPPAWCVPMLTPSGSPSDCSEGLPERSTPLPVKAGVLVVAVGAQPGLELDLVAADLAVDGQAVPVELLGDSSHGHAGLDQAKEAAFVQAELAVALGHAGLRRASR